MATYQRHGVKFQITVKLKLPYVPTFWFVEHTHTHTHTHTYTHTHIHTHTYTYIHTHTYLLRNFKNVRNYILNVCNARRIFPWGNEMALKRWRKNTAGRQHRRRGSHDTCWCLYFNWTPLNTGYVPSWSHVYLIPTCAKFDLHPIFRDVTIA